MKLILYSLSIDLWNVFGECENIAALQAHKGAILDVQYSIDGANIFTASTDKTIIMWDSKTMTRVKKMKGHSSIVNSCHASRRGPQLLVSTGDDCSIRIWDLRDRKCSHTYKDKYQNLAVTFNENSDQVIFGGIDNLVKVYDIRKGEILYSMVGHFDSITGLSLSPDGSFVLSNAMDNTCKFSCLLISLKVFSTNFISCIFQCAFGILDLLLLKKGVQKHYRAINITPRRIY